MSVVYGVPQLESKHSISSHFLKLSSELIGCKPVAVQTIPPPYALQHFKVTTNQPVSTLIDHLQQASKSYTLNEINFSEPLTLVTKSELKTWTVHIKIHIWKNYIWCICTMKDMRSSQECYRRPMWHCWVSSSPRFEGLQFCHPQDQVVQAKWLTQYMKALQSFDTSATTHPITQSDIPQDQNHLQHIKFKSSTLKL